MSELPPDFKTVLAALELSRMIVHFAVGFCCMHQDVGKILRGSVDVSLDVVSSGDESVTLSSDVVDVTVDGCCVSSRCLSLSDGLFSLSKLFVECS